jgi:hypothetical protein
MFNVIMKNQVIIVDNERAGDISWSNAVSVASIIAPPYPEPG